MWQPQEDEELLSLWPNFSASEIGRKLCRTRNAVIGRYHRIKKTYADEEQARIRRRKDDRSAKKTARRMREAAAISEMKARIASGRERNLEIARAHQAGAGQPAIGDVFGITRQAVSLIVKQIGVCRN